ncbi:Crp/Fnr family transcriptional regulator [Undibacterium sp. SXout7W]|uniref:Crp/Fnr family transcriptional regulator n=1 Tax=Undibacterium sp. SXout7W TaxID=3413049 RepID=UPI003BF19641
MKNSQNPPDLFSLLSRDPWFGALPVRDRKTMLAASEVIRLRPGEMLFRQGDVPGGFYALISGRMKMSTLNVEGKEAILSILDTGTWFGEISLLDHQPRTHDATAFDQVELLVMPETTFHQLMQRQSFSMAIARLLARRIRLLYGIVEDANLRSIRARVARRLLFLTQETFVSKHAAAYQAQEGMHTRVNISQDALAMMLGVTRQTLSKELKLLSQQGAIRLAYRAIDILSAEKLNAFSDKD